MFHGLMKLHGGFDLYKHAAVVPINFCALKATRAAYKNCLEFTERFIDRAKAIAIVSNDVFKAFFNEGTMPELLHGKSMRDERYEKVFFFFSDYRKLEDEETEEEQFWQRRVIRECFCFRTFLKKGEA